MVARTLGEENAFHRMSLLQATDNLREIGRALAEGMSELQHASADTHRFSGTQQNRP